MSGLFIVLSFATIAQSLVFPTPAPTNIENDLARELVGWAPKPTPGPLELRKREEADYDTCGWYEDDELSTETITCPTGTCMLYTPSGIVGMAGCCTSSAGSMDYQNCGWVNQCYDYLDIEAGDCDNKCMSNSFVRLCTESDYPYCQSWTYPGPAVRDYGCGTDPASTWITVSSTGVDVFDETATAHVPFVPAKATITGWKNAASGTGSGSKTGSGLSASEAPSTGTASSSTAKKVGISVALIAVVAVVILLGLCCAGGIIAFFCIRSKRNTAKLNQTSTVAGVGGSGQLSNVIPLQTQYGSQQSHFEQHTGSESGAAANYYHAGEQKLSAGSFMQSQATPTSVPSTPAPPYSQPYAGPQPPIPQMAPTYASNQAYGQPVPQQHYNNALEMPSNPVARPAVAELG